MTVAFPSSEGMDLLLTLGQIIGGPLGYMIQSIFSLSEAESESDFDLDLSQLPSIIEKIPQVLAEKGGSKLIMQILSKTKRCNGQDQWHNLREQKHFDAIYASNYLEMFKALAWVLEVNFAPFSEGNTPSWKGLWSKLSSIVPITQTENQTLRSVKKSLRTVGNEGK